MSRRRRFASSRARSSKFFNEINVTPFVDVMLVLLVIFMVSAPMLAKQVGVKLPAVGGTSASVAKAPMVITVTKDGELSIDTQSVSLETLSSKLQELAEIEPNHSSAIWVRADKAVNYGTVAEIIALIQRAGFNNVSLASVAEKPAG